jgi:AcrR family transcriptional regulator
MQREMKKTSNETKAGILAAAYSVLSQRGIEQTTIKEVARVAGVAPGLVHYYFASKDLLLQEVLQVAGQRYVTLIEQMLTLPPRKLAKEILQEPQTRLAEEPEWYRFRYELLAIGLHNDAVAPSARMMLEKGRECIASMIQRITGTGAGGEELSAVLMSCFDGLAIQKIIDPAFDSDRAYKTLQKLFRPVLEVKSES